ncbi:hypothetical protein GN958_ATG03265 [Phytophthora infestans]|uniref:Uncharacterized protein n=1 Tax=Phytophthora infestans TaxID=4787 RepID=A0A8S9V269_PHYIN|nr:hypothetical protein GN958_ATG03265 [Phytophthora infestans]
MDFGDSDLTSAQGEVGAQLIGQSTATLRSGVEAVRREEFVAAPDTSPSTNIGVMIPAPEHVSQAIRDNVPLAGFTVVPKRRGERSIILAWGAHISATIDATKHLGDEHLLTAANVTAGNGRNRSWTEQQERILSKAVTGDDGRKMTLLLETMLYAAASERCNEDGIWNRAAAMQLENPRSNRSAFTHRSHHLEDWFQEKINKAIRERKAAPEGLPIADDKETLLELYGLLNPVAALNTKSQKEDKPSERSPVGISPSNDHFGRNAAHPRQGTVLFRTSAVLPSAKYHLTRQNNACPARTSISQELLHSLYGPIAFSKYSIQAKSLAKIVKICNEQLLIDPEQPHLRLDEHSVARNVASVKVAVTNRLRVLMLEISKGSVIGSQASTQSQQPTSSSNTSGPMPNIPSLQKQTVFSEDLMEFTEETAVTVAQHDVHEARVDEELDRSLADPSRL